MVADTSMMDQFKDFNKQQCIDEITRLKALHETCHPFAKAKDSFGFVRMIIHLTTFIAELEYQDTNHVTYRLYTPEENLAIYKARIAKEKLKV